MKVFIPIKTESQRVNGKNFRTLSSKKLYQRVIDKVSTGFLRDWSVYVDTDSDEIIYYCRDIHNVTAYRRLETLEGNEVSVCNLIDHFIREFEIIGPVCQVHTTTPFLKPKTLKNAYRMFNKGYDSVVSCTEFKTRFWRYEDSYNSYAPINHNPARLEQTQDLPPYYEENSAFYMFYAEDFIMSKMRIGLNPYFFKLSFPENMDIDTEDDWKLVELYETSNN